MRVEQNHIDDIRKEFAEMQSREDLLNLLNKAKPLLYGAKTVPFELKQLTWYGNPKLSKKRYKEFSVKKKSGALRTIHAPVKGLKAIQRTLAFILKCMFEPHYAATGFALGKSILDNARIHEGNKYVFNIDLKDFFPSIDQARVWKCLQLKPFNLVDPKLNSKEENATIKTGIRKFVTEFKETIFYKIDRNVLTLVIDKKGNYKNYRNRLTRHLLKPEVEVDNGNGLAALKQLSDFKKQANDLVFEDAKKYILTEENISKLSKLFTSRLSLANLIASLCCTEMIVERLNEKGEWTSVKRNVLPQGAPTSPVITNIICQRLDHLLSGVAKRFGLKYSRYADDITFSSMHNVYQENSEFIKELHRIVKEQGFHIKESKTRLQKDGYRKEVTGLLVNEKANVQQRYIKQLRKWLYYWERYGYERASGFFFQDYLTDKGHIMKGKPDMANVIAGKLDYLKMVKGNENELYLKLKGRFDELTGKANVRKDAIIEVFAKSDGQGSLTQLLMGMKSQPEMDGNDAQVTVLPQAKKVKSSIPIIHNPKELVTLLKNFSINDSALKYTTHSWDAGRDANMFKDLAEFLAIAKKQYAEFSFNLKTLSENLNGKIYNFLFNKEISNSGWGDIDKKKRIYFGWSSPELLDACQKDASLNPEDFILPEKYQLQKGGKTLQKFKHVIDVFKNEIEIRDENSALLNLILQKHDRFLMSFADPIISNLDNKTFYTDVQWLSKALDMIFENIQSRPQHRQVRYSLNDDKEDAFVLEILHVDSFNIGKSIHDEKLQLVKGNFGDICKYLKNLCDWSIESQFAEGCFRINYLTSDVEELSHQRLETAVGFKHILTFYK